MKYMSINLVETSSCIMLLKISSSALHCTLNTNTIFLVSIAMSQVYLTPCSLYVSSDIKWDEMNILQTLHPPDKDYGFMKIDEPKTPFSYTEVEGASGTEGSSSTIKPVVQTLDPEAVIQKIQAKERRLSIDDSAALGHSVDEDEDEENLTEEEKHKRREFETKRKSHYNEFQVRFFIIKYSCLRLH